jgi:hypothetical protein
MSKSQKRSRALGRVITRLERGQETETVSLGEASDHLGRLGPLYLMMGVASVAVSPVSGIPFVTAVCGVSIAALAAQLLLRRRSVWLPRRLRGKSVDVDRLTSGLDRADRVAGFIENRMRRRWVALTGGPVRVALLVACVLLGLGMPFLEVIPFAGTTFAATVLLISLALISRDGLAALLGAGLICAALVLVAKNVMG